MFNCPFNFYQHCILNFFVFDQIEIWHVGFCKERKIRQPKKNYSNKDENQQQTQPIHDTQAMLVRGKHFHHHAKTFSLKS